MSECLVNARNCKICTIIVEQRGAGHWTRSGWLRKTKWLVVLPRILSNIHDHTFYDTSRCWTPSGAGVTCDEGAALKRVAVITASNSHFCVCCSSRCFDRAVGKWNAGTIWKKDSRYRDCKMKRKIMYQAAHKLFYVVTVWFSKLLRSLEWQSS